MPAFRAFLLVIFFVHSHADKYDYQRSARFAPCDFRTLTANIRRRRGSKVAINLPLYIDERTPRPFVDPTIPWHRDVFPEDAGTVVGPMVSFCKKPIIALTPSPFLSEARHGAALIDHIYMDAMGFGMGCCCLQLTFQCCNIEDARRMYDGLIPLGPIMVRTGYHPNPAIRTSPPSFRLFVVGIDRRKPTMAGLHRGCGLPVERHRWKRRRPHR